MEEVRLDREVQRGAEGPGLIFLSSVVLGKTGEWLLPLVKQQLPSLMCGAPGGSLFFQSSAFLSIWMLSQYHMLHNGIG